MAGVGGSGGGKMETTMLEPKLKKKTTRKKENIIQLKNKRKKINLMVELPVSPYNEKNLVLCILRLHC